MYKLIWKTVTGKGEKKKCKQNLPTGIKSERVLKASIKRNDIYEP